MFFGKRRDKTREVKTGVGAVGEEIIESAKTSHGRYTLIPRAKQLVNGRWIARVTLEEDTSTGVRTYDFAGPMADFESRDDAVRGGIEHAKRRLDDSLT